MPLHDDVFVTYTVFTFGIVIIDVMCLLHTLYLPLVLLLLIWCVFIYINCNIKLYHTFIRITFRIHLVDIRYRNPHHAWNNWIRIRLWQGIHNYVCQVGGFCRLLWFPSQIKLTGFKHYNSNPILFQNMESLFLRQLYILLVGNIYLHKL
jgi:hypothetical protein